MDEEGTAEEDKEKEKNKKEDIPQDTLQPITKANSKLDKELQEWEVESSKGGGDLNQ